MQDTYGPPLGKKLLMFVDDVNMPCVDTYGTQQPIALLKLFVERKGFYDRGKELSWKNVKDVQMVGAMGPPGGARNNVDPRFISLFSVFEIQAPSNSNLRTIHQVCCSHWRRPYLVAYMLEGQVLCTTRYCSLTGHWLLSTVFSMCKGLGDSCE